MCATTSRVVTIRPCAPVGTTSRRSTGGDAPDAIRRASVVARTLSTLEGGAASSAERAAAEFISARAPSDSEGRGAALSSGLSLGALAVASADDAAVDWSVVVKSRLDRRRSARRDFSSLSDGDVGVAVGALPASSSAAMASAAAEERRRRSAPAERTAGTKRGFCGDAAASSLRMALVLLEPLDARRARAAERAAVRTDSRRDLSSMVAPTAAALPSCCWCGGGRFLATTVTRTMRLPAASASAMARQHAAPTPAATSAALKSDPTSPLGAGAGPTAPLAGGASMHDSLALASTGECGRCGGQCAHAVAPGAAYVPLPHAPEQLVAPALRA